MSTPPDRRPNLHRRSLSVASQMMSVPPIHPIPAALRSASLKLQNGNVPSMLPELICLYAAGFGRPFFTTGTCAFVE